MVPDRGGRLDVGGAVEWVDRHGERRGGIEENGVVHLLRGAGRDGRSAQGVEHDLVRPKVEDALKVAVGVEVAGEPPAADQLGERDARLGQSLNRFRHGPTVLIASRPGSSNRGKDRLV